MLLSPYVPLKIWLKFHLWYGSVGERWKGRLTALGPSLKEPPLAHHSGFVIMCFLLSQQPWWWGEQGSTQFHVGSGASPMACCRQSSPLNSWHWGLEAKCWAWGSHACTVADLSSIFLRLCLWLEEIFDWKVWSLSALYFLSPCSCKLEEEAMGSLDCLSLSVAPRHTHRSHQSVPTPCVLCAGFCRGWGGGEKVNIT